MSSSCLKHINKLSQSYKWSKAISNNSLEQIKSHGLTLLMLNVCNICNKLDYLQMYVKLYKPTFIAITESWAHVNILDSELQLSGYLLFRKDRESKREVMYYYTSLTSSIAH